jgi:hypothetical protein
MIGRFLKALHVTQSNKSVQPPAAPNAAGTEEKTFPAHPIKLQEPTAPTNQISHTEMALIARP